MISRILVGLRGTRRRIPDHQDAHANDQHPDPTRRCDHFTQEEMCQQCDHTVSCRRSWLNVTVIRPREHQHVSHEERNERAYAQPNCARSEDAGKEFQRLRQRTSTRWANPLHPLPEEDIAKRAKNHHQKDQELGFKVQTVRRSHAEYDRVEKECLGGTIKHRERNIKLCYWIFRAGPNARNRKRVLLTSTSAQPCVELKRRPVIGIVESAVMK